MTSKTTRKSNWGLIARLVLLVLTALAIRLLIFQVRLQAEPDYRALLFDNVVQGGDQGVYITNARLLLKGEWPTKNFFYQPGNSFWLGMWLGLFNDSLLAVQIVTMILGSLNTLLVFVSGKLALESTRGGLVAAMLYVLYPIMAFYDTTLLIAPAAMVFTFAGLTTLLLMTHHKSIGWAIASGLIIGAAAMFRSTLVILLPVGWVAAWAASTTWKRRIVLAAVVTLVGVAALAPASWWNTTRYGKLTLSTATGGDIAMYRGNNRDADGTCENSQAYKAVDIALQEWEIATQRDIKAEPVRTAELYLRKFSLMWVDLEIPHLVDYQVQALARIPLLHISPLNYGLLAFLSLGAGFLALFRQRRLLLPFSFVLGYAVMTAVVCVWSRYRLPMVAGLFVLAAYALTRLLSRWREGWRVPLAFAVSGLLMILFGLSVDYLPRPRYLRSAADLPEGFIQTDAAFGESIHLLGYRLDQPEVYVGEGMLVSLIWQVDQTPDKDYSVSIQMVTPEGNVVGRSDSIIGMTSFPKVPMTTWPPQTIYHEQVLVFLSSGVEAPIAPTLYLTVYDKGTLDRLEVSDSRGNIFDDDLVPLGRSRMVDRYPAAIAVPSNEINARFGDALELRGYELSQLLYSPGDELEFRLVWNADAPLPVDAVLFVHLVDSEGELVAQADRAPLDGSLPTSLWKAGDVWEDWHSLSLPDDLPPGDYVLRVGLYDWTTGVRVPITDPGKLSAGDNALTLSTVSIEP